VIIYPSVDEVLLIHQRVLFRSGGTSGIRDTGALESAIARPQSGYYKDIIEQAAALL
jgi:death-on-curing protein